MKNEKHISAPGHIFVYGTLRLGFDNPWANFLRQHTIYIGVGKMKGHKFDLGKYPGAVFDEKSAEWVEGDVFEFKTNQAEVLEKLDEYEGVGPAFPQPNEFVRVPCPVLVRKHFLDCWVYLFNRETK